MRLRILFFTLTAMMLSSSHLLEAQQARKIYRVGFLRMGSGDPNTSIIYPALRDRLNELGYIEGQNLVLEYRSAEGKPERRPQMAAELVRLKVDVIVTPAAPGLIRAAQGATHTIPIVMTGMRVDPVKAGFVKSLARPGGNITGLTNFESELHPKRLELLKEAFPGISRVAIIWPRDEQEQAMKQIEAAGLALGIQIQSLVRAGGGRRSRNLESAFSAIGKERPDALLVGTSGLVIAHRARIREFTVKMRLPTIYAQRSFVDDGGLMSYGPDFQHLYRRLATYVDKILKGARPADLPVEQPMKFEFIINLKTAKQIGLTIPPNVLARADKVIQ